MVAHLAANGLNFVFQGGTALHTRLPKRKRFSIDVDVCVQDQDALTKALRQFAARFAASGVILDEPPEDLSVQGVRHVLRFPAANRTPPLEILVEAVPLLGHVATQDLELKADDYSWGTVVQAPTAETFFGQKMCVLAATTVGRTTGLNKTHARLNQGAAKQLFDLQELMFLDLDPAAVTNAFEDEVTFTNGLRATGHSAAAVRDDIAATALRLRAPRTGDEADTPRHGLWRGFRDSRRYVLSERWDEVQLRATAGRLHTLCTQGVADWARFTAPVRTLEVPAPVRQEILNAQQQAAPWWSQDFGPAVRVAWGWNPAWR